MEAAASKLKDNNMPSQYTVWKCNKCGHETEMLTGHGSPKACPACGHKVLLHKKVIWK